MVTPTGDSIKYRSVTVITVEGKTLITNCIEIEKKVVAVMN
jgi:hypothetical protein